MWIRQPIILTPKQEKQVEKVLFVLVMIFLLLLFKHFFGD